MKYNNYKLLELASKVLEGSSEHKPTRIEQLIDELNRAADKLENGVRVYFESEELREIAKYLEILMKNY